MEAIVLAGGLGTRLRSVVSDLPKPMANIHDVPFLEYIFSYLYRQGVSKVILSVGYKWEIIQEYFNYKYKDIEILYCVENEPLGTGGAIKKAIELAKNENVYIINGDTFFNVNLSKLYLKPNNKLVLSLKPMKEFDRYGCVEINSEGFVTKFSEKEYRQEGNINGGVYLASSDIFNDFHLPNKFSFEDFLQENFKDLFVGAEIFDEYFIDIGIPEDYSKAQIELKKYL